MVEQPGGQVPTHSGRQVEFGLRDPPGPRNWAAQSLITLTVATALGSAQPVYPILMFSFFGLLEFLLSIDQFTQVMLPLNS